MSRPKKTRSVKSPPLYKRFKPPAIPASLLQKVELSLEEYESIRLADYEGLGHEEAATLMEISRSSFSRLVERARAKVARFLIEGRELVIDGGSYDFRDNRYLCHNCRMVVTLPGDQQLERCSGCGSERVELLNRRHRCCKSPQEREQNKTKNGEE